MIGVGTTIFLVRPQTFGGSPFTNEYSLLVDGADEYVDISTPTGIASSNGFSVSMWIKSSNFPTNFGLFTLYTSGTDRILCYKTGSDWRFYVCDLSTTQYTVAPFSLSINTWYHVCFVYDGTQGTNADRAKIYVNASDLGATAAGNLPTSLSATSSHTDNFIGRYLTQYFNGNIDEPRWYNYALTSGQVTDIYNSGTPKDDDLGTPSIHWWRFEDADSSWGGSNYTFTDVGTDGTNTGTSVNVEEADRETDVP